MSLEIQEEKQYEASREDVYEAAVLAVTGLEGKFIEQDKDNGRIVAKFHKTILGKVLGDRSHLEVTLTEVDGKTTLNMMAYPLNAIGQKLQFGARKGVLRTVLTWFYGHLDHHLGKISAE